MSTHEKKNKDEKGESKEAQEPTIMSEQTPVEDQTQEAVDVQHMLHHITTLETKNTEYMQDLQRLQAEFENYQKRIARERMEFSARAKKDMIGALLPVLDHLGSALRHAQLLNASDEMKQFKEGVELTYTHMLDILRKEGLQKIESDTHYNPLLHEALAYEEGDEDNKIIEVMQEGFMYNNVVIRPAKVKISKQKK